jgi:glyoxylase-like metal-dependent hydrolase (beta-lactamase superfamily II)
VRQLRVGRDNFSYLIHDPASHEAALVDPGMDASNALDIIRDEGLDLKYVINTHNHSDHVASNGEVLEVTGAKLVASREDGEHLGRKPDIWVAEGDEIGLGQDVIKVIRTPGHTPGGICLIAEKEFLLTGDTLFIGDCGRCDLPGGSLEQMFESLQKLKGLNDDLVVFPGHDYGEKPYDTLGNQKRSSGVLLARDLEEFSTL